MKSLFAIAIVMFMGNFPAKADDAAEKLIVQMLKLLEELRETAVKVDDKDAADKALPVVKELGKKMDDVRSASEKLKLKPEEEDALFEKYKEKLLDAGEKMGKEIRRLKMVDPAKDVVTELAKIVEKMGIEIEKKKK